MRARRAARPWTALALCAAVDCGTRADAPPPPDVAAQRAALDASRKRVEERIARETAVREVLELDSGSDVVVGLRSSLVEGLVQEVARRYLDRVELDLDLETAIDERREVELPTPLGRITAGEWSLHVVVHRVHGTLRARTPELGSAAGNRLELRIPVVLEGAEGAATARFKWDARTMARVVCRDFEITRQVRGRVLPDEYTLSGQFQLSAGPRAVVVQPVFATRRFRLRVDLVPESWKEVRGALEEQDQLLKCGLAIDPEQILPKLRDLLRQGFEVQLPRSLFRSVELPAGVRQSVAVEDRQVDLAVLSSDLRVTDDAVWYGASVRSRLRAPPSPTGAPRHPRARPATAAPVPDR